MKKTKVCHLTSVHSRYDTRIFKKICTSLASSEYDVYLIVADGKKDEIINNIKIKDVGLVSGRLNRIINSPKQILKKALELDCELYHFHDPELFPIAIRLKKKGKKVIFDSHEYLPGQILDKKYLHKVLRKLVSYCAKKYYDIKVKMLDAVISVTPHIVEEFELISDNAFLLTNYPILCEKNINFNKEEYMKRENNLFYAGTIYETSQQEYIINALENVDNVKYILVGNITENYKQILIKLPSWKKVKLVPFVSKEELDVLAEEATIGLAIFNYTPNLGNKRGSLGVNKIFEYMLYGLPIICTDFDLWKGIIQKYNCGICVTPNNIKENSDAIRYLTDNKEIAYMMGQNGKKAVEQEFNWNTQEKKLLDIYKTIL